MRHTASRQSVGIHEVLTSVEYRIAVNPLIVRLSPTANRCEEGFTLDQAGIVTRGFSSNFTAIEAGKRANITTLFAVHDTFFENGVGLRKDWQTAWTSLQASAEYCESVRS